jgi:hypothetical protein
MLRRVLITIPLLAAVAGAQSATEPPPLRSPFSSPVRAMAIAPARAAQKVAQADADKATAKPVVAVTTKPATPPSPAEPEFVKAHNARDPFLNPVQTEAEGQPACTSVGKRCLVIDKIRLQGVVRADSGFIAVVVNAANRTFFLRENDPLWNGYVLRITNNAVTFRENGKDRFGRSSSREVTKTLGGPPA